MSYIEILVAVLTSVFILVILWDLFKGDIDGIEKKA